MKLKKTLRVGNTVIPAGTVLNFGTEGVCLYKGVRVSRSMIPAAAIESVSQKRGETKILAKSIRFNGKVIPAGESLSFNAKGIASYKGMQIAKKQIPTAAFANEALSPVTLKMPVCVNGTVINKGTKLMFSNEGMASYKGKNVSIYDFPTAAIEMDERYAGVNNAVNNEAQFKNFDNVEPGDRAQGQDGQEVRILGKAIGKAGYDALVTQFGNVSELGFDELTAELSDDEVAELQFVAYSTTDGTVMVGRYGADYVAATEAEEAQFIDIKDVQSGDAAVSADGKPVTIVAKGVGTVWYTKMLEALQLECRMKDICERLGLESDDCDELRNADFVLVTDKDNNRYIDIYGANGVKVLASED